MRAYGVDTGTKLAIICAPSHKTTTVVGEVSDEMGEYAVLPLQLLNVYPFAGVAISVTLVPDVYRPPEGDTVPAPAGLTPTVKVYNGAGGGGGTGVTGVKMAAISLLLFIMIVTVGDSEYILPLHSLKV